MGWCGRNCRGWSHRHSGKRPCTSVAPRRALTCGEEGCVRGVSCEGARANRSYDHEVTPRLMVLKITGTREVAEAASEMRGALNGLRKLMLSELLEPDELPMDE